MSNKKAEYRRHWGEQRELQEAEHSFQMLEDIALGECAKYPAFILQMMMKMYDFNYFKIALNTAIENLASDELD
jgi:hypothetical protein